MKVLHEDDTWRLDHVADGLDALANVQVRMVQLLCTPARYREPAKVIIELEEFVKYAGEQLEFSITEIRDLLYGDIDESDDDKKKETPKVGPEALKKLQAFIEGKAP